MKKNIWNHRERSKGTALLKMRAIPGGGEGSVLDCVPYAELTISGPGIEFEEEPWRRERWWGLRGGREGVGGLPGEEEGEGGVEADVHDGGAMAAEDSHRVGWRPPRALAARHCYLPLLPDLRTRTSLLIYDLSLRKVWDYFLSIYIHTYIYIYIYRYSFSALNFVIHTKTPPTLDDLIFTSC